MSEPRRLVASLFGSHTASDETFGDRTDLELFEIEETTLGHASRERLAEFRTARSCAREALRALGVPCTSIPIGAEGAPVWPEEVVGSITHCRGYRAAVVARRRHMLALGLDAEPDEPLPPGIAEVTFTEREIAAIQGLRNDTNWDRLLFSAKEALFKLQTQLGRPKSPIEVTRVRADGSIKTTSPRTDLDVTARWVASCGLFVTSATANCHRSLERRT